MTSPAGVTFVSDWGWDEFGRGEVETGKDEPVLLKGGSVDLVVPARDLTQASWALDRRMLAEPGAWTLQVYVFEEGKISEGPAAMSTPAKLVVETPRGPDEITWRAIQERDWTTALASVYPGRVESAYFPYLAVWYAHEDALRKAEVISEAVSRHPDSPVVPSLRFALAYYYAAAGVDAFYRERSIDKAVEHTERARAELLRAKQSGHAWASARADSRIAGLRTRAMWEATRRSLDKANARNQ
ncbi:MAG TPA: hypothetical protein VGF48_06485 [Thermoanaerobaculia bacterium]|jgi:hypothetical protein